MTWWSQNITYIYDRTVTIMPKKTFFNLKPEKREAITDAFLREFALKTFDEASISEVVKTLGIAKGSIYQYFDDKLDLFIYLIGACSAVKRKYTDAVSRHDFPDFWSFFRELYLRGYQFDEENPLESHFLHKLSQNLNSPSVKKLYEEMLSQIVSGFEAMVQQEMERGRFRNDISLQTQGFALYKLGVSIQEQLEHSGVINPKESIQINQPVYRGKKEKLMKIVDEYIALMKPAFDKP